MPFPGARTRAGQGCPLTPLSQWLPWTGSSTNVCGMRCRDSQPRTVCSLVLEPFSVSDFRWEDGGRGQVLRDPRKRLSPDALSDTHPRSYALDGGGGPVPSRLVLQPLSWRTEATHTDTWSRDPGAALERPAYNPCLGLQAPAA